jgi:hypothetical protein
VSAPIPPEARKVQGRIAAASRHHPGDTATIANDKRQYRYLVLEDYIKRVVDAAPPLTPAQRDRLALLLRGGDAA